MRSDVAGKIILDVEVTQIDMKGIWVLIGDIESFLPFKKFPRFREASVGAIHNVTLLRGNLLHWADLDIEVPLESIESESSLAS